MARLPFVQRLVAVTSPLACFTILVFFTGGASRADVPSLLVLRPIAVLFFFWGLYRLRVKSRLLKSPAFIAMCVFFAIPLLHLIPLPPSLWQGFAGRDIVVQIDKVAGLSGIWRPLSLDPIASWNSVFALFVPAAVLVWLMQSEAQEKNRLMVLVLVLGLLSGLLGVVQELEQSESFYLYSVTNYGSGVGLFADRNHQATLLACLFPMLTVLASTRAKTVQAERTRNFTLLILGLALVPLILVTGSRMGVVSAVASLMCLPLLFVSREVAQTSTLQRWRPYMLSAGGIIFLALVTYLGNRAESINRLFMQDPLEDSRVTLWASGWEMLGRYFPFGSGVGSFQRVYEITERQGTLNPSYMNHAHNDILETAITSGVLGVALMLVFLSALIFKAYKLFGVKVTSDHASRMQCAYQRLGLCVLVLLLFNSLVEYPLRTPLMETLFMLAIGWFIEPESV
jgi:O-antigen ligase